MLSGRESGRRFYSREQAVIIAVTSVVMVGVGLGSIFGPRTSDGRHPLAAVIFGIVVIVFAVAVGLGRCARAGVVLSERELRIVNPLRTHRLSIEEVRYFDLGRSGLWPRVGMAHLKDGRVVHAWGIQGVVQATRPNNHRADETIQELNAEVRDANQGEP